MALCVTPTCLWRGSSDIETLSGPTHAETLKDVSNLLQRAREGCVTEHLLQYAVDSQNRCDNTGGCRQDGGSQAGRVADVHRWDLQWRYTALVASLRHGCLCGRGTAQRHAGADAADRKTKRIRVVVVGSGWSAMSFIKAMRKDDAQVQCSGAALSIQMRNGAFERCRDPSHTCHDAGSRSKVLTLALTLFCLFAPAAVRCDAHQPAQLLPVSPVALQHEVPGDVSWCTACFLQIYSAQFRCPVSSARPCTPQLHAAAARGGDGHHRGALHRGAGAPHHCRQGQLLRGVRGEDPAGRAGGVAATLGSWFRAGRRGCGAS